MLTYRVGHGGAAGATAMSNYLHMETLAPEQAEAAAYYLGAVPPMPDTLLEDLERQVHDGGIAYSEALDLLMRAGLAAGGSDFDIDVDVAKAHIETQLAEAATRRDFAEELAEQGGTVAELRRDLSPQDLKHFKNEPGAMRSPSCQALIDNPLWNQNSWCYFLRLLS